MDRGRGAAPGSCDSGRSRAEWMPDARRHDTAPTRRRDGGAAGRRCTSRRGARERVVHRPRQGRSIHVSARRSRPRRRSPFSRRSETGRRNGTATARRSRPPGRVDRRTGPRSDGPAPGRPATARPRRSSPSPERRRLGCAVRACEEAQPVARRTQRPEPGQRPGVPEAPHERPPVPARWLPPSKTSRGHQVQMRKGLRGQYRGRVRGSPPRGRLLPAVETNFSAGPWCRSRSLGAHGRGRRRLVKLRARLSKPCPV
jgi:hypothetical protein